MIWALIIVGAYVAGMFPSAILVARASGVDITSVGSGNPGAANIARNLGWKRGALVFALDGAKGAIGVGIGLVVDDRPLAYLAGAAAILGHCYPISRGFKGGKGVATGGGAFAVLTPLVFLVLVPAWVIISKLTKTAALASLIVLCAIPVGVWVSGRDLWEIPASIGIAILIALRHASNIQRMRSGSELSL